MNANTWISLILVGLSAALFTASAYILWRHSRTRLTQERMPLARVQLVDALIDPVLALDIDGLLVDLNPAAERLFGVENAQIIGQPVPAAMPAWTELLTAITKPPVTGTRTESIQGANQSWYDTHITPITAEQGQLSGWLIILHDITRQKNAEAQAARLAMVVEQAQETIVITDLTGQIEYANPFFEKVTGYSVAEAKGANPHVLNSGHQTKQVYEDLWGTITNGKSWSGQFINRRKDGSLYHEHATIFPLKDAKGQLTHFAAVKRDISAQIKAEQDFQESQRLYRLLADNVTDVIWVANLQGRFSYVSPSVQALRGFTPEEMMGQNQEDILTPDSAQRVRQQTGLLLAQARAGGPLAAQSLELELEQVCKDGSLVWTESIINVMYDHDGQAMGLIGVTRDISDRKQSEARLQQQNHYQKLINEITVTALSQGNLSDTLQVLADQLGTLLEADGCYITLWDTEKQRGIPAAAYGPQRESYVYQIDPAREGEATISKHLYQTRQILIVPDAHNSPYLARRLAEKYPTQSLIGLPLVANDQFLGAALISFHETHPFTQEEIERGEQAARQIALSVLKNHLLDEAKKRATEAETLRLAGSAIASTLHRPEAIKRILEELQRVVPYDSASVLLPEGDSMEIVGALGFKADKQVVGMRFKLSQDTPNTLVIKQRQVLILPDAPLKFKAFRKPPHNHIRGWMGVPILADGELMGMLTLDSIQPARFTTEHARLASAFADQVAIALDNSRLFEEVQRLAITDSLTGLFNRRHIMFLAERDFERARRYDTPFSVIMLDIDFFKNVNDTYGHLVGDLCLQDVAKISQQQLRASDTIGRYGGEELMVILPETTAEVAGKVAERLRAAIEQHSLHSAQSNFQVTISLGVTGFDKHCVELNELIDRADQALYRAKNLGRNQVIVWPFE